MHKVNVLRRKNARLRVSAFVLAAALLLMECFFGAVCASAAKKKTNFENEEGVLYDGDFCYIADGKGAIVIGYTGDGGNVDIPEKLGGRVVRKMRRNVFLEDDKIISVNLPSTMEDISTEQFCLCSNLKSVTVSKGNKTYTSVDGVLYKDGGKTIALHPAANSEEYDIPSGVTKIGAYSFFTNKKLTRMTIPDTVTEIGRNAFYNCELLREVYIPDSVTKVRAGAFSWCNNLKELRVPPKLSDIGRRAFFPTYMTTHSPDDFVILGDSVLVAYLGGPFHVDIPNGVKKIADVFYADENVERVSIPESVTSISDRAFYGCTSLEKVIVPDTVKTIGDWAFYGCVKLTEVNIPAGCSVGPYAFGACEKLKGVNLNTKKISVGAFEYCKRLSNVTIGKKVKIIDDYAFYACEGLSELKLPKGLSEIGGSAFRRTGLKKLRVYAAVEKIGSYAFKDNDGIVLTVTDGSAAHKYAKKNGLQMKVVEKSKDNPPKKEGKSFFQKYKLYIFIGGGVLVLAVAAPVITAVAVSSRRKKRGAAKRKRKPKRAKAGRKPSQMRIPRKNNL